MMSPSKTNYDIFVQNFVPPSVNMAWSLLQKYLRYIIVGSEYVTCSNIAFQNGDTGTYMGALTWSYNDLWDKLAVGAPDNYESLPFFPDKSLSLRTQKELDVRLEYRSNWYQIFLFEGGSGIHQPSHYH
jgi:hypothetical protein